MQLVKTSNDILNPDESTLDYSYIYGAIQDTINKVMDTMAVHYNKLREAQERLGRFETRSRPQERQEPSLEEDTPTKVDYRDINPNSAGVNPNSAVRQNPNNPWNHWIFQTHKSGPGPNPGGSGGPTTTRGLAPSRQSTRPTKTSEPK